MVPDKHAPLSDLAVPFAAPELRHLLGAAANCVSIPILILASDRTILVVNEALAERTGYAADELRRHPAAIVVPEGGLFRAPPIEDQNPTGAALTPSPFAAVARRKDGSQFPVSVYLQWLSTGEEMVG